MTKEEIINAYLSWLDRQPGRSIHPFIPFTNEDVFEDSTRVINRLYYVFPKWTTNKVECFIVYEENEFKKDANGDLFLTHTSFHFQKE